MYHPRFKDDISLCGDIFIIQTNIESLFCTLETNITLYSNYTSIKKLRDI